MEFRCADITYDCSLVISPGTQGNTRLLPDPGIGAVSPHQQIGAEDMSVFSGQLYTRFLLSIILLSINLQLSHFKRH